MRGSSLTSKDHAPAPQTAPEPPESGLQRLGRLTLRFSPAIVLILGLVAVVVGGGLHFLSLSGLDESRAHLRQMVEQQPLVTAALYLGLYVVVISLSLPAALIMTLAGGFLFGPWLGGLVADLGCSAGSMVAYAVCRLAVGDSLDRRASPRIKAFEQGFRKDAFFYLLTLRLIPVTPLWLVNIAAGVLGVAAVPFLAATMIGILPASLIFASLGSDLDRLFQSGTTIGLALLLAPRVAVPLIALALLSVLPIVHHWWRARRAGDGPGR
jgi:uncharacterized membrane protein YdjX (TVP38/TMEM64 family)